MPNTGPSDGFLERVFGPKKKKRTEDINLPSQREQDRESVDTEMRKPRQSKSVEPDEPESDSILTRAKKAKRKYNPFDAYVRATGGKTSN